MLAETRKKGHGGKHIQRKKWSRSHRTCQTGHNGLAYMETVDVFDLAGHVRIGLKIEF